MKRRNSVHNLIKYNVHFIGLMKYCWPWQRQCTKNRKSMMLFVRWIMKRCNYSRIMKGFAQNLRTNTCCEPAWAHKIITVFGAHVPTGPMISVIPSLSRSKIKYLQMQMPSQQFYCFLRTDCKGCCWSKMVADAFLQCALLYFLFSRSEGGIVLSRLPFLIHNFF